MKKKIIALLLCLITVAGCLPVTVFAESAPVILEEPSDCYGAVGEEVSTSVVAQGDDLTYQWYYRNKGNSKFKKAKYTTPTYYAVMSDLRDGCKIYCVVTNGSGKSVKSQTVTLKIPKYAAITTQPKTVTVAKNKTAKVTVKASGDGLKYTWYVKNKGASKFTKASTTSATYSVKMTSKVNGRQVYCVVKDKYGKTVKTSTATLKLKK